jgi:hypothetical protein
MWVIRNKEDWMIAVISDAFVSDILSKVPGEWKKKEFDKGEEFVYTFTEAREMNAAAQGFRIPLFKGYYLRNEKNA